MATMNIIGDDAQSWPHRVLMYLNSQTSPFFIYQQTNLNTGHNHANT